MFNRLSRLLIIYNEKKKKKKTDEDIIMFIFHTFLLIPFILIHRKKGTK